jgi:hypothetical protein
LGRRRSESIPYRTASLDDTFSAGNIRNHVVGALWLMTTLGFLVGATGAFVRAAWWPWVALTFALQSLILCIGWPKARIGVVVNVGILAFLFAAWRIGWALN